MATITPSSLLEREIWLGRPIQDLALIVLTPLFIVPIVALLRRYWSDEMIATLVVVLGANAHHLPGFIRAYGDPIVRRSHFAHVVIAPIGLASVCLWFAYSNMSGLAAIALLWGVWHGLAQVYGLGRMYDAKLGQMSARHAALDKGLCIAWFAGGLIYSPNRLPLLLGELYKCGVAPLPPGALFAIKVGWACVTLVVTVWWALRQIHPRAGPASNPAKLLLFASSIAFWWYANLPIAHVVLGVALFELFHDVQYLTIVWIYNRKLTTRGGRLNRFWGALFRPSPVCIIAFVALCWTYGAAAPLTNAALGGNNKFVEAIALTSLMLHFYFDSFIWNVREERVRLDLDLQAVQPMIRAGS